MEKLICPHCNMEIDTLSKVTNGHCSYQEYGRFNINDLINYVDNIDDIDDEDVLEEELTHGFWEIDTENTDYDNHECNEEIIECRNCGREISTREIAEMIIKGRKKKDDNLKFFIKNADKLQ